MAWYEGPCRRVWPGFVHSRHRSYVEWSYSQIQCPYLSGNEAGFGYPVVVASNNNFIEAVADTFSISLAVKDTEGKEVYRTNIGRRKILNTAESSQQGNNRQN
jgi:hypothetical protein